MCVEIKYFLFKIVSACKKALTTQKTYTSNSVRSFFTYAENSYHPPGTT